MAKPNDTKILVIITILYINVLTITASAQDFRIRSEPLFTKGIIDTSNLIIINPHLHIDLIRTQLYQLEFGITLQDTLPSDTSTTFVVSNLPSDFLYFYRVLYSEESVLKGQANRDTTNVDSSYQDAKPATIDSIYFGSTYFDSTTIILDAKNHVGKLDKNELSFFISDRQKFFFFEHDSTYTIWTGPAEVDTGAGIARVVISRTFNSSDIATFKWDKTEIRFDDTTRVKHHPVDTTFVVKEFKEPDGSTVSPLDKEGNYTFNVEVIDAAYHPDQVTYPMIQMPDNGDTTYSGNKTTFTFKVVYDTTGPKIDFTSIKRLHTIFDYSDSLSILLKIGFNDSLTTIDTSSCEIFVTHITSGDTVKQDSKTITCEDSTRQSCESIVAVKVPPDSFKIEVNIKDQLGNQNTVRDTFFVTKPFYIESVAIKDTTIKTIKNDKLIFGPAEPGFTNDTTVFVTVVIDPDTGHPFINEMDTLWLALNENFNLGKRVFAYDSIKFKGTISVSVPYDTLVKNTTNTIYAKIWGPSPATDFDSIMSNIESSTIVHDDTIPTLNRILVLDKSSHLPEHTDEDTVLIRPFWQQDDTIDSLYVREESSGRDTSYFWTGDTLYEFAMNGEDGLKTFTGQIRDKAGNWSETATDSIMVGNPFVKISFFDCDTTECDSAVSGYTNNTLVCFNVDSAFAWPDSIKFYNRAITRDTTISINSNTLDLSSLYPFLKDGMPKDTLMIINYYALRNDGAIQADTLNDSLHYDNDEPVIDSLRLDDYLDIDFAAIPGYTNDDSILVIIITQSSDLIKMKIWVDVVEPDTCSAWTDTTIVHLPSIEDTYVVSVKIRDFAGNWSEIKSESITRDTTKSIIKKFNLTDLDGDSLKSDSLIVKVRLDVTDISNSNSTICGLDTSHFLVYLFEDDENKITEKLFFEEGCQYYLDTEWNLGLDFRKNLKDTLFVEVRDLAGNLSMKELAIIQYDTLLIQNFILFDKDDRDSLQCLKDSIYTNNDTITAKIRASGMYTEVQISEDWKKWVVLPQPYKDRNCKIESDTLFDYYSYVLRDTTQGKHTLCVRLFNENTNNYSLPDTATITLDKTPPHIFEFHLEDTTIVDRLAMPPTLREFVPFDSSWTNNLSVWAIVDTAHDELSGIDSVEYNSKKYKYQDSLLVELDSDCLVHGSVSDSAGTWLVPSIKDTIKCDFVEPEFVISIDTLFYDNQQDTVLVPFNKLEDDQALWKVIASKDTLFNRDSLNFVFPSNTSQVDQLLIPLDWHSQGPLYFIAADRAGNASRIDSVYFKPIGAPTIAITFFDKDEFEIGYRDSLYIDENAVVLKVDRLEGELDLNSLAFTCEIKSFFVNETSPCATNCSHDITSGNTHLFNCSFTLPDSSSNVTLIAQGKNSIGVTGNDTFYTVVYNTTSPLLNQFSVTARGGDIVGTQDSLVKVCYAVNHIIPLAAIVLNNSIFEIQEPPDCIFFPLPMKGINKIFGYVIDSSDIPNDLGFYDPIMVDHASIVLSDEIQFDVIENTKVVIYPNPFDPHSSIPEENNIKLLFNLDNSSDLEISIFDPFGNLVKKWTANATSGFNDGRENSLLTWDGKNGDGRYVANGGYICVIKPKNSGQVKYGKIAVIKR